MLQLASKWIASITNNLKSFCLFCFICSFIYFDNHREHLSRDAKKVIDRYSKETVSGKADSSDRSLEKRICTAITAGYFMNSAVLCAHGNVFKYMSLLDLERQRNKQEAIDVRMVHIHPTSSLCQDGAECPHNYLLYQALVHSSKLYMKQIAKADSKLLKTLQREWQYVDPFVLCGRQHERAAHSVAMLLPEKGVVESSGKGQSQTGSASGVTAAAGSRPPSSVPAAEEDRKLAGAKRPLSPSRSGEAAPIMSNSTGDGAKAAAEAAKQRYMERLALQKARKN